MDETTQQVRAAHGAHTTDGIPQGVTSLTPFLVVPRAREAIAFYRNVFGARVVDVTEMGGVVAHAVLDFGHGQLQLGEPLPDYHLVPPPAGETTATRSASTATTRSRWWPGPSRPARRCASR